jgi:hypothetical protein
MIRGQKNPIQSITSVHLPQIAHRIANTLLYQLSNPARLYEG